MEGRQALDFASRKSRGTANHTSCESTVFFTVNLEKYKLSISTYREVKQEIILKMYGIVFFGYVVEMLF